MTFCHLGFFHHAKLLICFLKVKSNNRNSTTKYRVYIVFDTFSLFGLYVETHMPYILVCYYFAFYSPYEKKRHREEKGGIGGAIEPPLSQGHRTRVSIAGHPLWLALSKDLFDWCVKTSCNDISIMFENWFGTFKSFVEDAWFYHFIFAVFILIFFLCCYIVSCVYVGAYNSILNYRGTHDLLAEVPNWYFFR